MNTLGWESVKFVQDTMTIFPKKSMYTINLPSVSVMLHNFPNILFAGAAYALMQSTPCCIVKFITWMGTLLQGGTKEEEHKLKTDMINITIMDARKHKPGSFKETGFTLITLDKVSIILSLKA